MRKICLVSETYLPEVNGVANTLGYWVEGMRNKGIFVQVIRPKQHTDNNQSQREYGQDITVKGLPIPGYKELKFGLPCTAFLRKHFEDIRPDAIYVATEGPLGLSAVKAANRLGIPVLTGFHTNFQAYSRYYGAGWLAPIIMRYLRYFHNKTNGTLVPTLKQKQILDSFGFENTSVLSRGVDCDRFNPSHRCNALRESWGAKKEDPVFLYVGRIAGEKNVALIPDLSLRVAEINPGAKFVFVGDGPLKKELEAKYPHIIFCGMKTGEELSRHYASGDIFLFPSKTDTFGNVVTEAMASRLAILSFDDAAAKQHLEHNKSAKLAPIDNDAQFAKHITSLARHKEVVTTLRQNAWELAQEISWDAITDNLVSQLFSTINFTPKESL